MPSDRKTYTPLPPNQYLGSMTGEAYDQCLALENRGEWSFPQGEHAIPPCLAARVLGYALFFAPCDSGRNRLTGQILDCNDDDLALKSLADLYINGLIRVFRNPESSTPATSPDQSPLVSSREAIVEMIRLLHQPTINSYQLRKLVMFRDEHHCAFTGTLDWDQFKRDPTSGHERAEMLELAYIINESMLDNTEDGSEAAIQRANWASAAETILECFGGFSLRELFRKENAQSPLNAFMASTQIHQMFDSLQIWLVPARDKDQELLPNTYNVESTVSHEYFHRIGQGLRSRVTFKACKVEGETIPPPDPCILAVHAACAQIACMSGATEYINEFFRDDGEISVMTQPGAAYELARALRRANLS